MTETNDTLHFVAGGEIEFTLCPPDHINRTSYNKSARPQVLPVTQALPKDSMQHVVFDAAAMLNSLSPRNHYEDDRLREWYEQLAEFDPADAVNFRMYQALSTPKITYDTYRPGLPYGALTSSPDLVEFRFGKHLFQEGYYDNPEISEVRLTPKAAESYAQRRARLLSCLGNIARQFNLEAVMLAEHVNVSPFRGEQPLLGDPQAALLPYKIAAKGLITCFEAQPRYYEATAPAKTELGLSPWRGQRIRTVPGRFEYRRGQHSDRAVDVLTDGMRYGFEHFSSDADVADVSTCTVVATAPATGFDRQQHLELLRATSNLFFNDQEGCLWPRTMTGFQLLREVFETDAFGYGDMVVKGLCRVGALRLEANRLILDPARETAYRAQASLPEQRQYQRLRPDFAAGNRRLRLINATLVPAVTRRPIP
jgi:hypothetical protein